MTNKKLKSVFVIEVDRGSYDDWMWWIHGIYDCLEKAEKSKKQLLKKIEKDKSDKDFVTSYNAKEINDVIIKEYKLNKIDWCSYK